MRDYLLRLDEDVVCKACGKKFEIPSQHSLLFVNQLAGLPNDDELEEEIGRASGETGPEPEVKPALPTRHTKAQRLEVAGRRRLRPPNRPGGMTEPWRAKPPISQ